MHLNIGQMLLDLFKTWGLLLKILLPLLLLGLLYRIILNVPTWVMNFRAKTAGVDKIDSMSGKMFEIWLEHQFSKAGYSVRRTQYQGDHGADLIVTSLNGTKFAVQAKQLSKRRNRVGAKALGEVLRGKKYYKCDEALIITNQEYTQQAKDEARKIGIELMSRKELIEFAMKTQEKHGIIKR